MTSAHLHLRLAAATIVFLVAGAPLAAQETADPALERLAIDALTRLAERDGTALARQRILDHTLDRYLVAYGVPPEPAEVDRMLGTARRVSGAFARRIYADAAARAQSIGRGQIGPTEILAARQATMPFEPTPWDTIVVFPRAAKPDRVELELIDLQALHDTGFVWEVVREVVAALDVDSSRPTMSPDGAQLFAETVNAYGLLALRLAGVEARREHAPFVTSPHLRDAEKEVRRRAAGRPAATAAPTESPGDGLFTDVTDGSGVDFRHVSSEWIGRFRRYGPMAPTFSGGGVATADTNGDRRPDVVVCGGRGCAIFENRGGGRFADTTEAAGINVPGEARMPLLADFDNDGDRDLFVTYAHDTNRLFANRGDGRFTDVTATSGLLREQDISGPAIAFDANGDGRLDLYVGNFGGYLEGATPWVTSDAQNAQGNRLYLQRGPLRFEEVTVVAEAGNTGWAQALSHVDFDADGDQDIYIANDFGSNELLENVGDGRFRPAGPERGADDAWHGMNVSFTDLNRDERADILVTNIWGWSPAHEEPEEYNVLLLSARDEAGRASFQSEPVPIFVDHDSGWAWAGLFFDRDNDGDDDLLVVNGHSDYATFVQYRRHPTLPDQYYPINNGREPNLYYENDGDGLLPPTRTSGAEMDDTNSRSLALADFDADGDLDLAVTAFHDRARIFRNEASGGHWLQIDLEGDPSAGVNRDAIGAVVLVTPAGGRTVWRTVTGGEGYLGQRDPTIAVGLGSATTADVVVVWPGGERQRFDGVQGDRRVAIHHGLTDVREVVIGGLP